MAASPRRRIDRIPGQAHRSPSATRHRLAMSATPPEWPGTLGEASTPGATRANRRRSSQTGIPAEQALRGLDWLYDESASTRHKRRQMPNRSKLRQRPATQRSGFAMRWPCL